MRTSIRTGCNVILAAAMLVVAAVNRTEAQSRIVTQTGKRDAAYASPLDVPEAPQFELTGFSGQPCGTAHVDTRYWFQKSHDPDVFPFSSHCDCEVIRNGACQDDCFNRCNTCDDAGVAECEKIHACLHHLLAKIHCKLGYFTPTGCCGAGCPPFDCYHMCYALNPEYFDPRDGRVYAAASEGMPMAVPLAPNVNYTYNYGWGIPSSRVTPISRFYPEHGYIGR